VISKIININTENNQRVCSIDASTNNMAFAIFENKELICVGKINFSGDTIYKKIGDSYAKIRAFFKSYKIDSVVIEHTIFMNSPKTVSDLALIQGAILAAMWESKIKEMGSVSPITWQNYIGNKRFSKEEKILMRQKIPNKSESWYKTQEREVRKEKTIRFINMQYDKKITDNDVADACGIGHWAINNWNKAMRVEG
jgi:Holliday junction resolvasome RuvABC endonuclease subunit